MVLQGRGGQLEPTLNRRIAIALGATLGLAGLLAVALLGAAVFWREALLNSAPAREWIATTVREQTGRELTLAGKIRVPGFAASGFPWLQVEIGAGELGNPQGYEGPPLLVWNSLSLAVDASSWREEMPRVDTLRIDGLRLEAGFDAEGDDNFSDLGPLVDTPPPLHEWQIPSIELRGASLRYHDRSSTPAMTLHWEDIELQLAPLQRGASASSDIWRVGELRGAGRLSAHPFMQMPPSTAPPLQLEANMLEFDLDGGSWSMPRMQGVLGAARFTVSDWRLGFAAERPLHGSMHLTVETLALPAWLGSLGIVLPTPLASSSSMQLEFLRARVAFETSDTATHLSFDELAARVDETSIQGRLRMDSDVEIALVTDRVDVDRYLPLLDSGAEFPRDDPEAMLEKSLQTLRALPLNGSWRIAEVRVAGYRLRGIELGFETRIGSHKKQ